MANPTPHDPLTLNWQRALSTYREGKFADAERLCQQIVSAKSDFFDALHVLAVVQSAQGKGAQALGNFDRALALRPNDADALNSRGIALYRMGKLDEALASYDRALAAHPNHADTFNNRAVALRVLGRFDQALASYDRALALRPNDAFAFNNRGMILRELGRPAEALASFERALALQPNDPLALGNRGNALAELKRFDEALASYDRALALFPRHSELLNNRGNVLIELKRHDEALASFDTALALQPNDPFALANRGNALQELNRLDDALASYDRALAAMPDYAEALHNRGNVFRKLKRYDEALASYSRALALRPDYAEAYTSRGGAFLELKRPEEALADSDRAVALRPDYAEAHYNRANALQAMKRHDEALASYESALTIAPDHAFALGGAAWCAILLCDWNRRTRYAAELERRIANKTAVVAPFVLLGYSDDPALHLECARNFSAQIAPLSAWPLWTGGKWRHDKLRVAYLSADFYDHATANLMAELFEKHDRSRFEIISISFGVEDHGEMRKRLVAAFDQFHDVWEKSDREVAELLRDLQIDIAIDLKGYTQESRPGILAHRPVPIQANYLGFPGTMGTPFIDYIIADKVIDPFEHQQFFAEKIVHLPDCYQVNGNKRWIAENTPTRREAELPDRGFVFCCFNNNWKITPAIFDVWMRLLHQVEGSVLWLLRDNEGAERNLRQEARRRGIDPARLVFGGRLPLDEHLARHRLADLFLDTLPCNAHTTASDALWTGLPLVTCTGSTFAARVATSVLHAIGLPELITSNPDGYEALALKLARNPALLADIKAKLIRNRGTYPLFDTDRFARHLEAAYMTMWEIWQRSEAPKSFSVAPIE
jgi:protein O-GlcNAc transferase